MKILKFPLGIRFDLLKDTVDEDDISFILKELTGALSRKDVEGLYIFGGVCPLDERDGKGIYTVVFMNGDMVPMRDLYARLDTDAVIHSLTDAKTPYVQNNVIREFDGMEFFGVAGADGRLTEGSGRDIVFPEKTDDRQKYDGQGYILAAPNAFKGTISAREASKHIARAIRKVFPGTTVVPVPAADGGDGTLDAIENAVYSFRHSMNVTGPYGDKLCADYLVIDGTKAVIESALASGIALCTGKELDPLHATSYGTGELMLRAAHEGVKEIYVCLGGSATNDCGIGLARALGVRFLDADGGEICSACGMEDVVTIDASNVDSFIKNVRITAMCDVSNPLIGERGATRTFGRQKGANDNQLATLEYGMTNMARVLDQYAGRAVSKSEGAGAAGGMGAMLMAVFNAEYRSGSEAMLEIADFDKKLKKARFVITGEGRIDSTSLGGKAVGQILEHAGKANVPAAVIAGSKGEGFEEIERLTAAIEYSEHEEDALSYFDAAAERLAEKLLKL